MSRRLRAAGLLMILCGAAVGAAGDAVRASAARPQTSGPSASAALALTVTALADAYVKAYVEAFPEQAAAAGFAGVADDRLSGNALASLRSWQAREDGWAAELSRIDGGALWGTSAWATYGLLRETIDAARQARVCRAELWPANQMSGWQVAFVQLADVQPVGTDEHRARALARWRQLPRYLDTEIDNLREGLRLGYSTPRRNVQLVVAQLDALLNTPPEQSPFYSPARRDRTPGFAEAWRRLLVEDVRPAMQRYRDFLAGTYASRAREAIAITAHPDGGECYRAMLRVSTTLDRTPQETFTLGEQEVARGDDVVIDLGRRQFGVSDRAAICQRVNADPANRFGSRDEVLSFASGAVTRARTLLAPWFLSMPKADVVIVPHAAFAEATASDQYEAPADDGSRPGTYRIKLYKPEELKRSRSEITVYHETYPGHHLQIAIANENAVVHPVARLAPTNGYVEGWARYAEGLAEEAGLYTTAYAKIARRMWPGHGMVADPGIHAFGWTRDRAIAYVIGSGYFTPVAAEAFVDRIVVWPGQAVGYDTGALEIRALRQLAERERGRAFDARAFHGVVLGKGAVTLTMLREMVQRWLKAGG